MSVPIKTVWAYDIGYNIFTTPEVLNEDAIKQSIDSIIVTAIGDRPFNNFGSITENYLFKTLSSGNGEQLLNTVIDAIKLYEDRVTVLENQCQIFINGGEHYVIISIPVTINSNVTPNPILLKYLRKIDI